jgi:hypothetical protein
MARFAPRYDPRIAELVVQLDEPGVSMAEVCRRVGDAAQELGITRPSLVHLRTLVRDERDRKEAERQRREDLRELAEDVAAALVAGRVPHPFMILDRIEEAGQPKG